MSKVSLFTFIKDLNSMSLVWLLMISIGVLLAIVGFIYLDMYLKRVFHLSKRSDVDGYFNNQYVNRLHGYMSFVLHTLAIGLILFSMSFQQLNVLKIGLMLIPLSFLFDVFMQWMYPVQRNEYKKTACYFAIVLIFTPIAYVVLS